MKGFCYRALKKITNKFNSFLNLIFKNIPYVLKNILCVRLQF